jgi:TRAP-type C4-dicarboxylate transport system substrate-binding protein
MKKKSVVLALSVMMSILLIGVSQVPAKTTILKFAYPAPAKSDMGISFDWWAKQLTERSNGQVKVETYPMQSLVKVPQVLDAVKYGVADLAMLDILVFLKRFPMTNVFTLPTLTFPGTQKGLVGGGDTFMEMVAKYKSLGDEFDDYKLVFCIGFVGQSLVSKNKIETPNDLKGLKIGATGLGAKFVESCGGVPVKISPAESYMSMERGVINTVFSNWVIVLSRQLFDVADFKHEYNISQFPMPVIMNKDVYKGLSDEVKKIIADLAPEANRFRAGVTLKVNGIAKKKWEGSKKAVTIPTAEQIAMWEAKGQPFVANWLQNAQKAGAADAEDILAELKTRRAEVMK